MPAALRQAAAAARRADGHCCFTAQSGGSGTGGSGPRRAVRYGVTMVLLVNLLALLVVASSGER